MKTNYNESEHERTLSIKIKTLGKLLCSDQCSFRYRPESIITQYRCALFQVTLIREDIFIKRSDKCLGAEINGTK